MNHGMSISLMDINPTVDRLLKDGADLAISISGGADSDAMAILLSRFYFERGWTGRIMLVHADLGRAEHLVTPAYIERFAERINLPLTVLSGKDLIDVIKARADKLAGQDIPPFPSAKARYCTSDLKRNPISTWLRHWAGKDGRVICAMGLRAEESPSRAKRPVLSERQGVHTLTRSCWDWLPIHHLTKRQVWETIGYSLEELRHIQSVSSHLTPSEVFESDFKAHPAYALGNDRLSCGLCIFGSLGDLQRGARQNPDVYRELVEVERSSGFWFQPNRSLEDVAPELLGLQPKQPQLL